jgi:hypothetical protein
VCGSKPGEATEDEEWQKFWEEQNRFGADHAQERPWNFWPELRPSIPPEPHDADEIARAQRMTERIRSIPRG